MPEIKDTADAVAQASWPSRVAIIRTIPEQFGTARHAAVYAAIASKCYAPSLRPDFGYIHWRDEYELGQIERAYAAAYQLTNGFVDVDATALCAAIESDSRTLHIFRLLLGFTRQEFAAASQLVEVDDGSKVGAGRVKSMEEGTPVQTRIARACATVIDAAMSGKLFPPGSQNVRSRIEKPDTQRGWESVRQFAGNGVPFSVFLHQRHYGGAFRQILDATGSKRGDVLEDAVEELFSTNSIPFVRTGSANQEEIERRFGLTVRPAPDFAVYDSRETLRAILECKKANDGGTARDKASRFRSLRAEAMRLGGIPVFGVLSGLGWRRARDALGPVIRDTDGRVFSLANLAEIMTVDPFPQLGVSIS
jgi:hypothetical protein